MRRRYFTAFFALALLSSSVYAADPSQEDIADVRCLAVAFRIAALPASQQPPGGVLLIAMFYLGRLDGRASGRDIEDLIVDQVTKMTPEDYKSEAVRCGNNLVDKGKKISQMGQDLTRRGIELQKSSAPDK